MGATPRDIDYIDEKVAEYTPARIIEIELGQPLLPIAAFDPKNGKSYQRLRCLVRLHTIPLGLVELGIINDELSPEEYAQEIWQSLHVQINEHLQQDDLPLVTELSISGIASPNPHRCV